jgi:hypothetical protein
VRRTETATIGRRLAQLRAPRTQKEQAAALGVPERTYQTYEQDTRDPDMRTLIGVFLQGWDLNWVLTGVGSQRLDPRALVEWLVMQQYPPGDKTPALRVAEVVAEKYAAGKLAVPPWVYEELPSLTADEALEIAHGAWFATAVAGESQEMSGEHLSVAVELAEEALSGLWLPRRRYYDLVALIYDGLTKGLPFAEIIAFARPAAIELAGGKGNDGRAEVGDEGEGSTGRGAATGNG